MTLPVAEDLVSTKHSPGTTFPHTHHNHNNTLNSFNYSHNHSHNYNNLPGFHHPPQTMSQRSDITTTTEAIAHGSGAHEASWNGHETDLHQQDFATMNSSSTLNGRNGRGGGEGGGTGWGFEFDIEAMKQSTGTRKKQQHRNGSDHSGDQQSIDGHGTDDDTWHTEGERSGTDSKAGSRPLPEVAWDDDRLDSNSPSHQHQENHQHQEYPQRQQHYGRQLYQERQVHHERPSRHLAHRSPIRDRQRPGAMNKSDRNSQHQWHSREEEDQESSNPHAGIREDHKADDAEDDVWGLNRTERWTATEEDEAADEKEVVLDELTKYWAPSNILDLIRPNRSTQAFSDKHTRHGGQPYDGDNWGDAPEPTMTYNGEYTNTVLVEQRNKQYWEFRDGEWILLNTSSGMIVTPHQKGTNSAAIEGDNDNGQSSEDESDNYSQGWSDYHPEDNSPMHSVDHESEHRRYSRVYPGSVPPNSGSQEFLSEVHREISPEQFDLDAGFIPEDEWRKPLSARTKKHEEGEPDQMRDDQVGSWEPEGISWERPASRASSYFESESVVDIPPDVLPDFRTAKPGEPMTIARTSIPSSNSNNNNKSNNNDNNDDSDNDDDNDNDNDDNNNSTSTHPPSPKTKVQVNAIESQPALLVDLDGNAATESPLSPASVNMVQSLIGLDFTEERRDGPQDPHPPALDSTQDAATAEITKVDPESADEDKQEKNDISTLVTISSESVDSTRNSAESASSKAQVAVDLFGTDIPDQELSKGESVLDLLGINRTAHQTFKEDSLIELLGTTIPTQDQPKDESFLDIFATANADHVPSKKDVSFDLFGASGPSQGPSFKVPLPGGFLDDLGSPYDWLNQIASRSMQQSEESRAAQKKQWSALMAKQEVDSNRIQDFIQKATTAATTDSASSTSASSKRGTKPKVPYSLAMAIETRDHGRQVLNVTERDDLKDIVERFCVQYDMQSYEMALWVTVAKAIKKKKKQLRESSIQQQQ